jgi:D-3-phosphoglycerate dehydrogenase
VRVVVTDHSFEDLNLERRILVPAGVDLVEHRAQPEAAALPGLVAVADVVLTTAAPFSAAALAAAGRCRGIVRYGVGVDRIDLAAATARGIPVCNVPDYGSEEVADHAWALALSLLRRLPQASGLVRAGHWTTAPLRPIHRLSTLTVGICGLGRIGTAVARRARASGCSLIACDPHLPAAAFAAAEAEPVDFRTLLTRSDLLTLHLPLSAATGGLIGASEFGSLKPGAYLVNTARGGLVDTGALLQALAVGTLAGAALDVLDLEPCPPDHPLLVHPRVIVTGHVAWYSEESMRQLRISAAEEALRLLRGCPPRSCVNPEALRARKA